MTNPSNHLDETKVQHDYSRKEGYTPSAEYKPEEHEYPKDVVIAGHTHIALDADHEARLQADHAPKVAEEAPVDEEQVVVPIDEAQPITETASE